MTTLETPTPVLETHASQPGPVASEAEVPFERTELKQFSDDDAEASSAIGKMLSLFFVYTVLAMTVSLLATLWWIRSTSM